MSMQILDFDFLVVGSGIAGLMSAIHLGRRGRVGVLTKKDRAESNTNYAQGGIACVVASDDGLQEHVNDTLAASAGLCDKQVVETILAAGPARIAGWNNSASLPVAALGSRRYDLGRERAFPPPGAACRGHHRARSGAAVARPRAGDARGVDHQATHVH